MPSELLIIDKVELLCLKEATTNKLKQYLLNTHTPLQIEEHFDENIK